MKVIILGSGPAAISASLYLLRANIETTIIANGYGALENAHKIENYYGAKMTGKELHDYGVNQAKELGAKFVYDEVLSIDYTLAVKTKNEVFTADKIIIATGTQRKTLNIEGIKEFEGKGLSYCASCDAFFYRGKDVAVIGDSAYALNEAKELLPLVNSVTVLTNNSKTNVEFPAEIIVKEEKIQKITGETALNAVVFENGDEINVQGVFVAMGTAGADDLAKKLGILTDKNKIIVNDKMKTNVPNVYAVGDCTEGAMQVYKAVYQGAVAAGDIIKGR